MHRRRLLAGLVGALAIAGCGEKESLTGVHPKELGFSVLAADGPAAARPLWDPLLDDLADSIGVKVKPNFASNYTSLVETMRFGQAQAGWFEPRPALEAVNRGDAEVLGRAVDPSGDTANRAVLIVRKGRGITLDAALACGRKFSFAGADPEAAIGGAAAMTYVFTPREIEPAKCFKAVRAPARQTSVAAVANGAVDLALTDAAGLASVVQQTPDLADRIETIWTSPPLPGAAILVRKDLDPALKEKVRQFFITYGTGAGAEADRQREVLRKLGFGGFRPADDSYLDPVREIVAGEALAEARKGRDKARVAAAHAEFDRVRAAAAQRRAANPDI